MTPYPEGYVPEPGDDERHPELVLVPCHRCGCEMRAKRNTVDGYEHIPLCHRYLFGFPYCSRCYPYAVRAGRPPANYLCCHPQGE